MHDGTPVVKIPDYRNALRNARSSSYTLMPDEVARMLNVTPEKAHLLFEYSKFAPRGEGPLELTTNGKLGPAATLASVSAYKAKIRNRRAV